MTLLTSLETHYSSHKSEEADSKMTGKKETVHRKVCNYGPVLLTMTDAQTMVGDLMQVTHIFTHASHQLSQLI